MRRAARRMLRSMRFTVGDRVIDPKRWMVREMGYGAPTHGREVHAFSLRVARAVGDAAIGPLVEEFVLDSAAEARDGILEEEMMWLVTDTRGRGFAELMAQDPDVPLRIIRDFLMSDFAVELSAAEAEGFDFVVNVVREVSLVGAHWVLSGEGYDAPTAGGT